MKVDPRFLSAQGAEIFTGNELLLKGALEAEGGTHLLGGYPGSPAAGFFDSMSAIKDLLNEKGIRAVIAHNEALAAAMLNGSQALGLRGLIAMKSVGVHVAADGLAMGNLMGAHSDGGAICVYGDDPWSDSTQSPSDSRFISKHLQMPVIEPSNPQEVKDWIDLSFKLSRRSQLYVGYLLTTNLLDGGGSVQCRPNQFPKINTNQKVELDTSLIDMDKRVLLPPRSVWQEESFAQRFAKAIELSRELKLNTFSYAGNVRKPIGFVTSGMAHGYLVQALFEMGLLGEYPIVKFGLSYPLDDQLVRQLASQCDRIVVVEERRSFIEEQINEIILKDRQANRPSGKTEVWGKTFPGGLKPIPDNKGLHPSILIARLVPLVKLLAGSRTQINVPDWADALDRELETIDSTAATNTEVSGLPARLPTFCPGCPHRDTAGVCREIQKVFMDPAYMAAKHQRGPVDLVCHGDAGCYIMMMFPPNSSLMHDYSGMGLGGGTGAGIDPFISNKKIVFMGDGTFFHSGVLAISQAIKLGQDITFMILDNRTTGMTGHQPTPGVEYDVIGNPTAAQDIEEVVRGVAGDSEAFIARVDPQKRLEYRDLLERTFLSDGVKIIIADKECGITRMRRKRRQERAEVKRRGYLPSWEHMNINQEACRFCLACAEMTGCPGLKHVETDYGRKMDTDVTWCVNDGACERIAACSSFEHVTIKRKRPPRSRVPELGLDNIPEPQRRAVEDLWRCCLVGVGGMGIGLATSIVVRAGHNEGYDVIFLDKKGMAIRNGGVSSQVVYRIADRPVTAIIPFGKADLLIGVDVLEAARVLDPRGRSRVASRERTAAVINTDKISTIRGLIGFEDFSPADLERLIQSHTRSDDFLARDISRICEKYLGSKLYANIMMLGFAFQKGLIPVSMHSMAWAIKDTIRADFRKNLYAFNMGRKLVVSPELFQGPPRRTDWRDVLEERCRWTIRRYRRGATMANQLRSLTADLLGAMAGLDETVQRDIVVRLYDTMRWGGLSYARQYASILRSVYERDSELLGLAATRAVVYNLAAAMLIKDAIFLSEISTSPEKLARDREKYNVNRSNGDRIGYQHLWHAQFELGKKKVNISLKPRGWMLKALKRMKWLRKISPITSRKKRRFLMDYLALVKAFAYANAQEYGQMTAKLGGPQCMNCFNPRCQEQGCPLGARISQWVGLVYRDQWQAASDVLHEDNNFPEFTSRICPALCQSKCKKGINYSPVQIRDIEGQIVDKAFANGWLAPQAPRTRSGRKVAVVGSGPAGLAAAQQLARAGHEVVVFEKDGEIGGLLRSGIPAFRLEKSLIDRRLKQLAGEGVEFRTGVFVGRDITGDQLREEYDAVLLAAGAGKPRDLHVAGRQSRGIYYALDFLRRALSVGGTAAVEPTQTLEIKGKVVTVIGGGETGNDCVEAALMNGAKEVHQLEIMPEPEGRNGLPQAHGEHAQVRRHWCVATKEFQGNGQGLETLKAVGVRWQLTPTGKTMSEIPGREFNIKTDLAVLAMGFEPVVDRELAMELGLPTDEKGRAVVREYATSVEGLFVAGDLASGASIVASAIHSGREAAAKINDFLATVVDAEVVDQERR